jgi:hypothetical protein
VRRMPQLEVTHVDTRNTESPADAGQLTRFIG